MRDESKITKIGMHIFPHNVNYYLFNKNNKSKKENSYADRDALKEVKVA